MWRMPLRITAIDESLVILSGSGMTWTLSLHTVLGLIDSGVFKVEKSFKNICKEVL